MKSQILSTCNPALQWHGEADLWFRGLCFCLPQWASGSAPQGKMCQLLLLATARSLHSLWGRRDTGAETAAYLYCVNLKFSGLEISLVSNTKHLYQHCPWLHISQGNLKLDPILSCFFFFPISSLTSISCHFLVQGEKYEITWWWPHCTEYCGIEEVGIATGTHVRLAEAVLAPKYKTVIALYTAVRVRCMVLISSNSVWVQM